MTSGDRSPADEDDNDAEEFTPSDEDAGYEAGSGEASSNEASSNEASSNEASSNEASSNEASSNEASSGEASSNEASSGEASSNEASSDEISSDDIEYDMVGEDGIDDSTQVDRTPLDRFLNEDDGPYMVVREVLLSVVVVLAIGLVLFAISGVWPPLVAVESTSMEPNMKMGDLVLVTEPGRYAPDAAVSGTGVVPLERGAAEGYETFGMPGSVIVFDPPDRTGSPIIHRAHHQVEEGENWYDRVDQNAMNADSCEELATCPAPYDGFITKGDQNRWYDQDYVHNGIAPVVHEDWVTGVARVRVPMLGWIRLIFTGEAGPFAGALPSVPLDPETVLVASGVSAVAAGRKAGLTNRWN